MSVLINAIFLLVLFAFVVSDLVGGDGGGGQWLVWMEWHPARLSVCLPLLIFPCTIKSRSSLLAPAHPGGLGKRASDCCGGGGGVSFSYFRTKSRDWLGRISPTVPASPKLPVLCGLRRKTSTQ